MQLDWLMAAQGQPLLPNQDANSEVRRWNVTQFCCVSTLNTGQSGCWSFATQTNGEQSRLVVERADGYFCNRIVDLERPGDIDRIRKTDEAASQLFIRSTLAAELFAASL